MVTLLSRYFTNNPKRFTIMYNIYAPLLCSYITIEHRYYKNKSDYLLNNSYHLLITTKTDKQQ